MNIDNFTNKAEVYAKGRPGYPKETIDKIRELASKETVFADIGAGTGKFTKGLAEYGYRIYAIELHWFDLEAFRAECHRIMKPDGLIMVIYNHVPGKEMTDFCRQAVDAFLSEPTIWTFQNPINYTRDEWLAYIASQDDSPPPGENGYDMFIAKLNNLFDRDSIHGLLRCDRVTKVYSQRIYDMRDNLQ